METLFLSLRMPITAMQHSVGAPLMECAAMHNSDMRMESSYQSE